MEVLREIIESSVLNELTELSAHTVHKKQSATSAEK